jgi:hypothetical protein
MAEAMMGGSAPQPTMEDFAAFEQIRQEVSPSEINETYWLRLLKPIRWPLRSSNQSCAT